MSDPGRPAPAGSRAAVEGAGPLRAGMLAVTGERPDYDQALGRIERFAAELPGQLKTSAAREMAAPRVAAMTAFLEALRREIPAGAKP